MGTDLFPQLMRLITIGVAIVSIISSLIILLTGFEMRKLKKAGEIRSRQYAQKKEIIVSSLTAITIALIGYVLLTAIGPTLRILFA